ncbi:hypothetical protein [Rhizobium tubonense]|uniref:Uncharacterized protein n=1 Tax=Rhizobium tubonense TaxID=484088 RepID=A0A2W4C0T7_9HYPH|nr:hypothetical protein [Rhizobium tubonense]PZM07569.1 hypothetical protein CPY51_31045 [Rhizobium tubonense]
MADHSDLYHASVTQDGEQIELGIYTHDQLRNIIVRTAPKTTGISAQDVLQAAIARDGTFEMDNWRIKVSRIHQ